MSKSLNPRLSAYSPQIQEVLKSCPQSGEGVHKWFWIAALKLHPHFPNKVELAQAMFLASMDCGRDVDPHEIEDAIQHSMPGVRRERLARAPRWPPIDSNRVKDLLQRPVSFEDLKLGSPRPITGENLCQEVINCLFPGDPLLCAAIDKRRPFTRRKTEMIHLMHRFAYIVPSPMTGPRGKVKGKNKLGARTLDNTGARHFLVVESDKVLVEDQPTLWWHLGQFLPLALMVHSGSDSVHAWFDVRGRSDEELRPFMEYAHSLGGDRAMENRCQMFRMPDGLRDGQKRQEVLYFNPDFRSISK